MSIPERAPAHRQLTIEPLVRLVQLVGKRLIAVNILTHLFGAAVFLYLLLTTWHSPSSHTSVTWHDPAGFGIFLASAVFCMGASALFHTANCHSPYVRSSSSILVPAPRIDMAIGV